ncbi:MAG: hypothetical protein HQL49_02670 [Gammaproteobacteria bacterium]|nr:hypothetical protein [Gammaproteobacteria bacterium]
MAQENSKPVKRSHEFILLALLFTLFVYIALDRIWDLRIEAERSHVSWSFGSMQSALATTVMARIASGRIETLNQLGGSNPFSLMTNLPPTYLGELSSPSLADLPPRSWYFDRDRGELIYRIGEEEAFPALFNSEPLLRFYIYFAYQDIDGDGLYDPLLDQFTTIELRGNYR